MNVLAVDIGRLSGYCTQDFSGEWIIGTIAYVERDARQTETRDFLGKLLPTTIVVIESAGKLDVTKRFDTLFWLGRRAGIWEAFATAWGFPVHYIHPSDWQRPRLYMGRGNPGRDALKKASVLRARAELGKVIGMDAADAYNMHEFVVKELKLGRKPWK